jgi:hypothetical protein
MMSRWPLPQVLKLLLLLLLLLLLRALLLLLLLRYWAVHQQFLKQHDLQDKRVQSSMFSLLVDRQFAPQTLWLPGQHHQYELPGQSCQNSLRFSASCHDDASCPLNGTQQQAAMQVISALLGSSQQCRVGRACRIHTMHGHHLMAGDGCITLCTFHSSCCSTCILVGFLNLPWCFNCSTCHLQILLNLLQVLLNLLQLRMRDVQQLLDIVTALHQSKESLHCS